VLKEEDNVGAAFIVFFFSLRGLTLTNLKEEKQLNSYRKACFSSSKS
jgi:hypothetical protein